MPSAITVDVLDATGKKSGTAELPTEVFGVEPNIPLIHQVVVAQRAAARQGTHATKTRGLGAGGGRKPYKQKGTGRARQGSIRAPQFAGGGTVHGPQPRDYSQRTPKKMKRLALRSALSARAAGAQIFVVDSFEWDAPKTKSAVALLEAMGVSGKALFVLGIDDTVAATSLRNLAKVRTLDSSQLNTYDVLWADSVVFTRATIETAGTSSSAEPAIVDDEAQAS